MSEYCKNCYELTEKLQAKKQECEELKENLKYFQDDCKGCPTCDEALYNANLYAKEYRKLKQTLAEIKQMLKEICMEECSFDWNKTSKKHCGDCDCRYGQILQKISECEVE